MEQLGMLKKGWFCPATIDFQLLGQSESIEKKVLMFQILKCENSTLPGSTVCKSPAEIDAVIKGYTMVTIARLKTYFD